MSSFKGSATYQKFWGEALFNRLNTNPYSLFKVHEERESEKTLREEIKKHGCLRTIEYWGDVKDTSTHIY